MKPVQIQFVAPRAWKFIWAITAVVLVALLGHTGWRLWQQHQVRLGLQAELAQLQQQLRERSTPKPAVVDPRHASEQAALRLLRRDWNRVFDAVESPELAQVRLVQMSVDAETGETRLEYELESFALTSMVTAALNGPGATTVWQLERVDAGAFRQVSNSGKARAVWASRQD
ncbi:hypothetical protein [Hydrogenophaga sp.]|uniref:hypothetical protein n=1 Tax=Hydrogenophaga sp. TaxID=1904254 RepID=UPI003F71A9BF